MNPTLPIASAMRTLIRRRMWMKADLWLHEVAKLTALAKETDLKVSIPVKIGKSKAIHEVHGFGQSLDVQDFCKRFKIVLNPKEHWWFLERAQPGYKPLNQKWAIWNTKLKAWAATDVDWKDFVDEKTLIFDSDASGTKFVIDHRKCFDDYTMIKKCPQAVLLPASSGEVIKKVTNDLPGDLPRTGYIHGVPNSHGWPRITNGVDVWIERFDGTVFKGHRDWLRWDKRPKDLSPKPALTKAKSKKQQIELVELFE